MEHREGHADSLTLTWSIASKNAFGTFAFGALGRS